MDDTKADQKANKHIIDHLRLEVERLREENKRIKDEHETLVRLGVKIPTTPEDVEIAESELSKDQKIKNLTVMNDEWKRTFIRLREILNLKQYQSLEGTLIDLMERLKWTKDKPQADGWYWVRGRGYEWSEEHGRLMPFGEEFTQVVLVNDGKLNGSWSMSIEGADLFAGPIPEPMQEGERK